MEAVRRNVCMCAHACLYVSTCVHIFPLVCGAHALLQALVLRGGGAAGGFGPSQPQRVQHLCTRHYSLFAKSKRDDSRVGP